jgi:hypothetical protein
MRSFTGITKSEWNRANNDAIALLHRAWMEVSGERSEEASKASKALAHAKSYLLLQTWGDVS